MQTLNKTKTVNKGKGNYSFLSSKSLLEMKKRVTTQGTSYRERNLNFPSYTAKKEEVVVERPSRDYLRKSEEALRQQRRSFPTEVASSFEFNTFSYEEIIRLSVGELTNPSPNGPGSVRDPIMGPMNGSTNCLTCQRNYDNCNGHYAHIRIPYLIHPDAGRMLILILETLCPNCGQPIPTLQNIIDAGIQQKSGLARLKAINELVKRGEMKCSRNEETEGTRSCASFGSFSPYLYEPYDHNNFRLSYTVFEGFVETAKGKSKKVRSSPIPQSPEEVFNLLDRLSDEDLRQIYGIKPKSHPRNLVLRAILVPPYNVRIDIGNKTTSYLSDKYSAILSEKRDYEQGKEDNITFMNKLQRHYNDLIRVDQTKAGKKEKGVTGPIAGQVTGKGSYMRGKGADSRTVNASARAVAAPGYNMRVDTLGVPEHVASKMVVEAKVSVYNLEEMQVLYEQGKIRYISQQKDNLETIVRKRISSAFIRMNPNFRLTPGDTVWRLLREGDVVVINRQPSLHRYSMLSFNVKIIPDDVGRVPLAVTKGYNMDFDGDEANFHFPQTIEAINEARILLDVKNNLLAENTGAPIIVMIQDAVLSAYMLTMDVELEEVKFSRDQVISHIITDFNRREASIQDALLLQDVKKERENAINEAKRAYKDRIEELENRERRVDLSPEIFKQCIEDLQVAEPETFTTDFIIGIQNRCEAKGIPWGSRASLFSVSLPAGFNYQNKRVKVEDGILVKGVVTSADVGSVAHNMVSGLIKTLGPQPYIDFLFYFEVISNTFLRLTGFSVGYFDAVPDNYEELYNKLQDNYRTAAMEVVALSSPSKTRMEAEQKEKKILGKLALTKRFADSDAPTVYSPTNPYQLAVKAGSKGGPTNLAQIIAYVGQQNVFGKRPEPALAGERTVPFVFPGENNPSARGFVSESYLSGLSPLGSFFHAMAVRENLVEMASNVPQTGFNMRRMVKQNEDVTTDVSGSVINGQRRYVQPVFGDTGFATSTVSIDQETGDYLPTHWQNLADIISLQYMKEH